MSAGHDLPFIDGDGFDPEERALCPDDSCIGVLDGAGRCKVCGRQGTAATGAPTAAPELAVYSPAATDSDRGEAAPASSSTEADSDDFADRRLCVDPGCIGVLDAAGRCKECGRVADASPSAT